jgi:hypothetical protein
MITLSLVPWNNAQSEVRASFFFEDRRAESVSRR